MYLASLAKTLTVLVLLFTSLLICDVYIRYFIVTDKYLETIVKGIFALDIIGRYLFKHNANNEAQYAYYNIMSQNEKIPVNYYAIFSSPQIAHVGFREQDLRSMTIDYYVHLSLYQNCNG
jgi:mycothione reductase